MSLSPQPADRSRPARKASQAAPRLGLVGSGPLAAAPGTVVAAPLTADSAHAAPAGLSPGETASRISDYLELFKIRVTGMIMLTAWAGFYLGSLRTGVSSMQPGLLAVLLGIGLVSAGAAALNEAWERKSDARMRRTARRPMAAGRISLLHGLLLAFGATAVGAALLLREANLLTALLTLGTSAGYVLVYTPLKSRTSLATFVGAFPGAMPPLLGWVAARGRIEAPAVALFALLFLWQFPHFMAISWLYREDYGRAGIRMTPVVEPSGVTTFAQAVMYATLLLPASLAPVLLGMAGWWYGGVAILCGLVYLAYAIRFGRITHPRSPAESGMVARDLLKVSVIYLPVLLLALMLNARPS